MNVSLGKAVADLQLAIWNKYYCCYYSILLLSILFNWPLWLWPVIQMSPKDKPLES